MGWGLWPRLKVDRPVDNPRCGICELRLKRGDKYYLEDGRAVHAVCVWKRADAAAQPSLPL